MQMLLTSLDLLGTFVFALSGAAAGVRHRVDLFGVLVLAFVAAVAGGLTRDVLIGAVPPAAISDWKYLAVSFAAALAIFYRHGAFDRLQSLVLLFDAMGLALFAVVGTQKALQHGMDPVMAALLGMIAGIGGGMARDLLLAQVPAVLRSELYATAALAGAAIVVIGHVLELPSVPAAIAGALLCFGLRLGAIRLGWRLPVVQAPPER
jgi:uncharacterized membrane protein YeiH